MSKDLSQQLGPLQEFTKHLYFPCSAPENNYDYNTEVNVITKDKL